MCGICGIAHTHLDRETLGRSISSMVRSLSHRGPDGTATQTFYPPALPRAVALGHTRLAIIDLSSAGRQPMSNEDDTVWVVLNGEIYNFQELRRELEAQGHQFRSRTDTEAIVHLYEQHGPECVEKLNGMFAVAILDLRQRHLLLARDPIGIKPLYYSETADGFIFGSEIKALLASGLCESNVNWQAIYDYFTYLYVPYPQTAFEKIRQLPPAHLLLLDLERGDFRLERYWQVRRLPEVEKASPSELKQRARELLADSVQRQLVSDVPLGVFLSGGIDSTLVAGLAKQRSEPLRTLTAIFPGKEFAFYDESETASRQSRHLGTEHHELTIASVEPTEILSLLESFDQPFANPTYYLMHLISKRAREFVKVALCGAGGDELYAGYPRYRAVQLAQRLKWLPQLFLTLTERAVNLVPDSYQTMKLRRIKKFFEGMDEDFVTQFVKWTYHFDEARKAELMALEYDHPAAGAVVRSDRFVRLAMDRSNLMGLENRLLHADTQTFLVDNLLEYTDKMSMAVALEVRVPILDQRFVEFSLNVPFRYKLRYGQSKVLLREAFHEFFAPATLSAPKKGFNAPLPFWISRVFDEYFTASRQTSHPLQDILGKDLGVTWNEGILNWEFIDQLRSQHKCGRRDNSYELFAVIVFDAWWRKYITKTLPHLSSNDAKVSACES